MKSEQVAIRRNKPLAKPNRTPTSMVWPIVGGAALVAIAALAIVSIPDIKLYIRISNM